MWAGTTGLFASAWQIIGPSRLFTAKRTAAAKVGLRPIIWLSLSALAACSGGGGSPNTPGDDLSSAPNRPPLVDAGEPQAAQGGGFVVLSGTAFDPEGGDLRYSWRQIGGPAVTLAGAASPVATFETSTYTGPAALEFELQVTNSASKTAADSTNVLVMTGYTPCSVTSPPAELDVAVFFHQKYCDANGQPILAPQHVPDHALGWVRYQMLEMLKRLPTAARAMIVNGGRVVIKGEAQVLTDIPEYSDLHDQYPGQDWDALPGVGAVMGRPVSSTSEENVLCYDSDPYRGFSVFIHEFAHSIHLIGLNSVDPDFEIRLRLAYDTAIASGLWADTYSAGNYLEYWAEGVGIWFDAHWSAFNNPEVIDTREELAQYDDGLYRLIREYFTQDEIAMCPPATP